LSVLDRSSLEASPLADLHTIASELSIDGYRRLRRPDLIAAILEKQSGGEPEAAAEPEAKPARRSRARTSPSSSGEEDVAKPEPEATESKPETAEAKPARRARPAREPAAQAEAEAEAEDEDESTEDDGAGTRRRRGRRGGRGRASAREYAGDREEGRVETPAAEVKPDEARPGAVEAKPGPEADEPGPEADEESMVEGVVELLGNGSGFIRVEPPDPSDDDVYISSAQVKRCELVSGDRIAGPKRAPRRSERFASLIRIETINGRPASELADSVRFDDLPAAFPDQRLRVGSEDPTLKAIEWLTPFGLGSRVAIVGASRAGKTEALRRLAEALASHDDLALTVVLAGVRPEEISDWGNGPAAPSAAVSFAGSEDAQNGAIEPAIDQARRLAARGADAVVLIDTLDGCSPQVARKALASARNIVDGGSVTVIATAGAPLGGETTVIALDVGLTSIGRFPAVDIIASGTMHPELLVGEAGAEAIARTRAEASETDD